LLLLFTVADNGSLNNVLDFASATRTPFLFTATNGGVLDSGKPLRFYCHVMIQGSSLCDAMAIILLDTMVNVAVNMEASSVGVVGCSTDRASASQSSDP
jgi:hypothetical protein